MTLFQRGPAVEGAGAALAPAAPVELVGPLALVAPLALPAFPASLAPLPLAPLALLALLSLALPAALAALAVPAVLAAELVQPEAPPRWKEPPRHRPHEASLFFGRPFPRALWPELTFAARAKLQHSPPAWLRQVLVLLQPGLRGQWPCLHRRRQGQQSKRSPGTRSTSPLVAPAEGNLALRPRSQQPVAYPASWRAALRCPALV
mmetsp:Transcript_30123/g.65751  ORF Transcript_30123/g.65751 Transcript_30123/m.65751 type:complete len:205 (+) Transcript_30123:1052-1666(+)